MEIYDEDGWFDSATPSNWTFWTDTPGIVFGNPSYPTASTGEPGQPVVTPNVTERTKSNSFTVFTEQVGELKVDF